jgi:serine/threonine protein kinase
MQSLSQLREVDQISDEYELQEKLGEGAFGTVHVAIKKNLIGSKFAIKSINAAKLEKQKQQDL